MRVCPSVRRSVGRSVRRSVRRSVTCFFQMPKMDNFLWENHRGSPNLTLLNVLNVLNVPAGPCSTFFPFFLRFRGACVALDHVWPKARALCAFRLNRHRLYIHTLQSTSDLPQPTH